MKTKRGKFRFDNREVRPTEDLVFSLVFIDTQVALWKDSYVWRKSYIDFDLPEVVDRSVFPNLYIKEGELTAEEFAMLRAVHTRTTFKTFEVVPEIVRHVYDVSYSHKDYMKKYGFLKKDADNKWYYLVPANLNDEEISKILSSSAFVNKRLKGI